MAEMFSFIGGNSKLHFLSFSLQVPILAAHYLQSGTEKERQGFRKDNEDGTATFETSLEPPVTSTHRCLAVQV